MAQVSGGDKMERALRRMAKQMGRGMEAHIGFLENATYPDGTKVALVALIQNFGAPAAGIPARPFFSNMIAEKSPEWAERFEKILVAAEYNPGLALARMAETIGGELAESITDTNDPPLKPETSRRKGHDKPLIDSGNMRESIGKEVVDL